MRDYNDRRKTLQNYNSPESVRSMTESKYEERIKCQNKCVKCDIFSCFIGFIAALGIA